jgi:choline dehydrogenase-like flavoprotein
MTHDAIVVGAGLGGGAAASTLATAGHRVLLLEQGAGLRISDDPRDHVTSIAGPVQGMGGGPHIRRVAHENVPWSFIGGVGGGTLAWGMQAWRFHPYDFEMATHYGVPEGSSLADWPIGYAELEPWYTRAEQELGVAGNTLPYARRSAPYPLQPFQRGPIGDWLANGAKRLEWTTFVPPLAVNTSARGGRDACVRCSECLGFTCPVDAKNGAHNAFVPRALATGLVELQSGAQVTRITTDSAGRVNGVEYIVGRQSTAASARAVIVAGGAIETARLLLLSATGHHPTGIGNHSDNLGRHLQSHTYPIALGILPPGIDNPNRDPAVDIATTSHSHDNPDLIGGAMMANDFVKTPVTHWRFAMPPDTPRWGLANKRAMRDHYLRTVDVRAPVQEIPAPENRVTLHPTLRDPLGQPVAALAGVVHQETIRTADFIRDRLTDWLHASGAERVWSLPNHQRGISDWFHQSGTCRMSADPADGVVDPSGRVHGHDNLFVADAAVHVTNGGFNPALTVLALALRTAANAASELTHTGGNQ